MKYALLACLLLSACASEEQAQQTATTLAQAQCARGGHRFVPVSVTKTPAGLLTDVTVSGTCQ